MHNALTVADYDGGMILTHDLEQMVAWLEQTFGMTRNWVIPEESVAHVQYRTGGALTVVEVSETPVAARATVEFVFEADDLDAFMTHLRQQGHNVETDPTGLIAVQGPDGQRFWARQAVARTAGSVLVNAETPRYETGDPQALFAWLRTHVGDTAAAAAVLVTHDGDLPDGMPSARPFYRVEGADVFVRAHTRAHALELSPTPIEGDPARFARFTVHTPEGHGIHMWTFADDNR